MKKLFLILLATVSLNAQAAQVGTVIVDDARVHEYPQGASRVISNIGRDEQVAVSNIPTEGYYKVRLATGEVGWVSGNDVYVGKGAAPTSRPRKRAKPQGLPDSNSLDNLREDSGDAPVVKKRKKKRHDDEDAPEEKKLDEVEGFAGDDSRILLMLGAQYPSYDGLKQYFVTEGITPGYGAVLEFQFKLSKHLHWAARAELNFANVQSKVIDSTTGKTQTIKQSSIPLQVGLNWSPVTSKGFRLGVGAYAGMALSSSVVIAQTLGTVTNQVNYSAHAPTALGVIQMAFGLGSHAAIVFEGGYRYQKTGTLDATTYLGTVPPIQIDYSGPVGHLGVEFKF